MDDAVDDRFRQRAVALGIGIDPLVPAGGLELRAEDGGAVAASAFHDLEKVVRFLWRQTADKPLIEDQQIYLLVCLMTFRNS